MRGCGDPGPPFGFDRTLEGTGPRRLVNRSLSVLTKKRQRRSAPGRPSISRGVRKSAVHYCRFVRIFAVQVPENVRQISVHSGSGPQPVRGGGGSGTNANSPGPREARSDGRRVSESRGRRRVRSRCGRRRKTGPLRPVPVGPDDPVQLVSGRQSNEMGAALGISLGPCHGDPLPGSIAIQGDQGPGMHTRPNRHRASSRWRRFLQESRCGCPLSS